MSIPYLRELIQIAQEELPSLQYDIQNASTLFTQQAALQRMHNIMTYLVHSRILEAYQQAGIPVPPPQAAQQPPPVAPPVARPPAGVPGMRLPPIGPSAAPQPTGQMVTEVIVTPTGSKVMTPGGAPMAFPPGAHIETAPYMPPVGPAGHIPYVPPAPSPQPTGPVTEIVLPQGGGLTPEVAAALVTARTTHVPPPEQPKPATP